MDQRTPLSQGALVRKYIIDKRIGEGASCLVYEAHYLDSGNHRKEIILKECYPYKAGITRVGNKIIWSDPAEQDNAFSRFDTAYEVAAKIQNTAGAKSVSVYSLDKFEENGTKYVATIPNGNSYDKTKTNDLADIIRTALALTNAVGRYHKAGYLHLDIKPSNFIATEDQTGKGKNIVLFDVDTVAAQEDIRNGSLRTVSYSNDYAAPEQKLQQIKKICPATDLFAVGAVLFERIMKRPVKSFDSGLFATWEYDSRFDVKRVNPKAKRLLTEIFHKTLAANVKRRYQSADDLARALSELCDVIESHSPYIFTAHYVSTCNFVGRSEELAELHKALADGKPVFVNGAGGIGKTELVKKYVSLHQDEYDAVVFMLYNGSVSECLNEIEIIGIDSEDKDNKSLLKEICDENVLLILDNYDVAPNESKGLDELFDLNCKVIVTTRTDFSERNPNSHFIEVSGLTPTALIVIFENESGLTLSDSEFEDMQTILHVGQECTYFWSMIARLAKEGAYSVSEIVEKVNAGLDDLEDSEDVFDTKDGNNINTTVATAMLVLFRLDELTDKDFEVLKALYFLDCLNMDKRQIKEMLAFSTNNLMNSFNALAKKGYIQRLTVAKHEVYRISDVLKNALENVIKPDIIKTENVIFFIEEKLFSNDTIYGNHLAKQDHFDYLIGCLFKIFSRVNWEKHSNAVFCIDKMYELMIDKLSFIRFTNTDNNCAKIVTNNLAECLKRKDITSLYKIKSYIILMTWSCFLIQWFFTYFDIQQKENELAEGIERHFYSAISEAESNGISEPMVLDSICKPIVLSIKSFPTICNLFSADIIRRIKSINPPCLQNEAGSILQSFKVKSLRNIKYEKAYLKEVLDIAEKAKRKEKTRLTYLAIGFIALNGTDVTISIDNELKQLRAKALSACRKMFFSDNSDTKPNLKKVYLRDFITENTLSEQRNKYLSACLASSFFRRLSLSNSRWRQRYLNVLVHPDKYSVNTFQTTEIHNIALEAIRINTVMTDGISLFSRSIQSVDEGIHGNYENNFISYLKSFEDKKAIINDYPSFKDEKGEYRIDLLSSTVDTIISSDCLYYYISKFGDIVNSIAALELNKTEMQEFIKVAAALEIKYHKILDDGSFFEIYDGSTFLRFINKNEVATKLNSIIATMYDIFGNRDKAYNYMELSLETTKRNLNKIRGDDKTIIKSKEVCEHFFLLAIKNIVDNGDSQLAVPLLYSYFIFLCDVFNVTPNKADERFYLIYLLLVKYAEHAKENLKTECHIINNDITPSEKNETCLRYLFTTEHDYDELIEKYTNLIQQIRGQEYHP